jgi:hypothetical protein
MAGHDRVDLVVFARCTCSIRRQLNFGALLVLPVLMSG